MSFYEPNGILAKIPGELISRAGQTLPAPDDGQPAELHAEIDVPDVGRVRYRLMSSRHHKHANWFWTAVFAELVN